jgi:hypothetical protein
MKPARFRVRHAKNGEVLFIPLNIAAAQALRANETNIPSTFFEHSSPPPPPSNKFYHTLREYNG